jgi:hypothetical protein
VGYPWHYLKSYNEKVAMEDGNNPLFFITGGFIGKSSLGMQTFHKAP